MNAPDPAIRLEQLPSFADAIELAVKPWFVDLRNPMREWTRWESVPAKVLAMPEMQAIRTLLRNLNEWGGTEYLRMLDVPENVLTWAVGTDG